jgi:dTDP-4-amino-4,6-dideoxygalactose transaminase
MTIARKHDITLIEDAAHAHGSEYKGRRVGAIGHMGSFSFQSSKNLTCGEGGLITTNDDALAERCRSIHNCGRIPGGAWYEHHVISANYRLGEFAGAILNCQLDRLDEQTDTRDRSGAYLDAKLSKIPGITPQKRTADVTRHAYHLYSLRIDESIFGVRRERVLKAITAEGVPIAGGYIIPLHRQPLFANKAFGPYTGYENARPNLDYNDVKLPVVEKISSSEGAWMTHNLLLGKQSDIDDIVRAFEKVYEHRAALATR